MSRPTGIVFSRPLPAAALLLGLLLLGGAGQAKAEECVPQRLVRAFGPATYAQEQTTLTVNVPSSAGTWFLTLERPDGPAPARVRWNGATVVNFGDWFPGLRILRVQVPVQATNTLEVRVQGQGPVTLTLDGFVPEASLPAGVGRRAAEVTVEDRVLSLPPVLFQVPVALPAAEGLWRLRVENGLPNGSRRVLGGLFLWNQDLVFKPGELGRHVFAREAPLRITGTSNHLRALLLGGFNTFVRVKVLGHVVDEAAPALAWAAPAPGATAGAGTVFRATFADAVSGILPGSFQVTLDGVDVTAAFAVAGAEATSSFEALALAAGNHTLVAQVRDRACNLASASLAFVVEGGAPDVTPPVITTPGDLVAEQTSPAGTVVTYTVTATDDRDPNPTVTCVPASGSVFPAGTTTVTCTARDAAGNESTASFQVLVRDTTPPVLTQPPNLVVEQTSPAGAFVAYAAPTAVDAADPAPVVSCSPASGSVFAAGTTTVTCTARDGAGNQSQVTFQVLVRDTTPPVLTQPENLVVEQTSPAGAVVTYAAPTAVDAADPAPVVSCSPASGSVFPAGISVVLCTARDAAGNQSQVTFQVLVRDTIAPSLTLAPAEGATVQGPNVTLVATWADAGSGVAAGSYVAVIDSQVRTADFAAGPSEATATITFVAGAHGFGATIRDQAGNETSASVTFSVDVPAGDVTPPTLAIVAPAAAACVGSAQLVHVTFSDAQSGVDPSSFRARLGGVDATAGFAVVGSQATATLGSLPGAVEGPLTLEVELRDLAGNLAQTQVGFTYDLTAPTLSLAPAEGATLDPVGLVFQASYADPCEIDLGSFRATLDGADVTAAFVVGATSASAGGLVVAEGAHTWSVRVRDVAGNEVERSAAFQGVARAVALRLEVGRPPRTRTLPDETPLLVLSPAPRAADGSGHDLANPAEGAAGARLLRFLAAAYSDGLSAPAGSTRPSPRAISNAVHAQTGSRLNGRRASDFLWIWGQFLDHDLSLTRAHTPVEPFPIQVPQGDPFFDPQGTGTQTIPLSRSRYDLLSAPREQLNELTAWIDASMVYGSDPARAAALRTNDGTGRLKTSPGNLLPLNTDQLDNGPTPFDPSFFLAGDIRANETVPLLAMHTLFVREHNRLADLLRARFPAATDEELYQGARRIVAAEIQVITYEEFLPTLLGEAGLPPYAGYDPDLGVGVENAFANAAFRLGHTLLSPRFLRLDAQGQTIPEGALSLQESFFAPAKLTAGGGIEPLLRGGARQLCQDLDPLVVDGVRNFLFGAPGQGGQDLPSLNLQRGREHGLPGYNDARRGFGLAARASFAQVSSNPAVVARLQSVYADVEAIDLWTGALCEDHLPGALVGELLRALLARQFALLRDGDRFFYRNDYSGPALEALENTRLADVIRRNTTIGAELSDDVFTGALLPFSADDLTIEAVTQSGAVAQSFQGFVLLSSSDGLPPLDGLLVEITAADQGKVTLPGLVSFQTLGQVTVVATSLEAPPLDISGSVTVSVGLQEPVLHPQPPATVAVGGSLVVQGLSFPGQTVELVVDGVVVASGVAGSSGQFTLAGFVPPGAHQVTVQARDPITGQAVPSMAFSVTAPEIPVQALQISPAAASVAVGQTQRFVVTRLLVNGASQDVTSQAAFDVQPAAVAAHQGGGEVAALSPGSATVSVSLDGFQAAAQLSVGAVVLSASSPAHGEDEVATTRELILRFSAPLDVASVTSAGVRVSFAGQPLPGTIHVAPDAKTVTYFPQGPWPPSTRVHVEVDGSVLQSQGASIDPDRDGAAGGLAVIEFETLTLTIVPGTSVCGRVFASELDMTGQGSVNVPLEGVKITVDGAESTLFTFTDSLGNFRLTPCPAGLFFVHVDGRTVQGVPGGAYYPFVGKSWDAEPGLETNVGNVYLPLIQDGSLTAGSATVDTVAGFAPSVLAQFPQFMGSQIVVPADSLYADNGTRGGMVGIAPVPPDRLPGPLPPGVNPPLVITIQTDGATNFDRPVAVKLPNLEGLAPGAKTALYSFNHDIGAFEVVATMTVTADGLFVVTDPGQGVLAPGWHFVSSGVTLVKGPITIPPPPTSSPPRTTSSSTTLGQEPRRDDGDAMATCRCGCPETLVATSGIPGAARGGPGGSPGVSVLPHSGEMRFERFDLAIPGRGQVHFAHTRTFRSQLEFDGPVGKGWTFGYNESLFVEPNGDLTRVDPSGHLDRWVRNADGSYAAPVGHFRTLVKLADGSYVLRAPDGFKCRYAADGRLVAQEDRFGNSLLFQYDARRNLDLVIDAFGREVDYVFQTFPDGKDRLVIVRDYTGREVRYAYDASGRLIEARSPAVVGTSTGNDYPQGKAERYTYTSGFLANELNGNLATVTFPEEVARGGPPALSWTYGTNPADPATFDKVIAHTQGGANASGIPAGGTTTFAYEALNQGLPPDPSLPRGKVTVTERNGNRYEYFANERNHHVMTRRLTRGLRPGEPLFYETRMEYDLDGQLTRLVHPEGNEERMTWGSGSRAAQRNLVEVRRVAGPRGGDGAGAAIEDLVTTLTYEPLYNQVATVTEPRGNSPTFVPPLGANVPGRYTSRFVFDYQEGSDPVPEAVAFGIDLSGIQRGLGDQNGDGRTDQTAGYPVRVLAPPVLLRAGSNEALRLGTTTQTILTELVWNDRGQLLRTIDPEGNVHVSLYHPENDPSGSGRPHSSLWKQATSAPQGYLAGTVVDAGTSPRRSAVAPPAQLASSVRYDLVGNVVAVRNPRGIESTFEVNALNEVVAATRGTDVSQAVATGQLITGEAALRYQVRLFYDHDGRVTRAEVENRDGNTTGVGAYLDRSTIYDLLGNPLSVTVEVDQVTQLTTTFRYDPQELLLRVTKPEGNVVETTYDERHLPFTVTAGAGAPEASTVQVDYDLNANRRVLIDAEDTDGDGQRERTTLTYDGFDRPVAVTDALGNRAESVYDPASNLIRSRVFGHRPNLPAGGSVLHADVSMLPDELGRVFELRAQLFLANGFAPVRPIQLLDQDSDGVVVSQVEFDALSRATFMIEDDLETSRVVFDGASRVLAAIDALGNRVERVFDQNSNVVLARSIEVSPEGLVPAETFTTRYVWDQFDRLVRATDNAGQTSRFGYDSRDNLVFRSDPQGPLTADPLGLFPGQINGPGNTCAYFFDGIDRMVRQVCDLRVGGTGAGALDTSNPRNPDGQVSLGYVFDGNSRLVGIVDDNGNRTSFSYDALDRRTRQTNADGEQYLVTFDRDSNVRTVTDPNGSVMTKGYDALNRLVSCGVARAAGVGGTTQQTFGYDGVSRLVRATDDNGGLPGAAEVCEWVFDSLGRQLEERQSGRVVSSVWTGDSKRLSCTYAGGRTISHGFDAIDRIKTTSDAGGQIAASDWIGPGYRELRRLNSNGTKLTFLNDLENQDLGYDPVQRVTRLRVLGTGGPGAPILDREYGYNRASQRTFERRNDDAGLTDSYTYDSLYRVVASAYDQAVLPGAVARDLTQVSYRFDGVGNRRDVTQVAASTGTVTEAYSVNAMNEYTAIGPTGAQVARLHDDNGNLLDDGTRTLIWDAFNRLVLVARKADAAPIAAYFYLPDGRRSRKVVYSQTTPGVVEKETRFVWDGAQEVEEQSAAGVTEATFVWSPVYVDELVEFRREAAHPLGAGSFYAHQDARCDVVAVTNASGVVVEKRRYDDFGREEIRDAGGSVVSGSPSGLEYGFQGRRRDSETGWLYFRARYYSAEEGRFLSRDPVWDAGNVGGWYTFCGHNPINRVDPLGLEWGFGWQPSNRKVDTSNILSEIGGSILWVLDSITILDPDPLPDAPPQAPPSGPDMRPEPPIPVGINAGLAPEGTGIFKPAELTPGDYRDAQELAKAVLYIMGAYAGTGRLGSVDDFARAENIRKFQQMGGTRTRSAFGAVSGSGGAGAVPPTKITELVESVGGTPKQCARGSIALNQALVTGTKASKRLGPGGRMKGPTLFGRLGVDPKKATRSTPDSLVDDLAAGTEPGTVGVVWGRQQGASNHIFNFVNHEGKIYLLDTTLPGGAINPAGYKWQGNSLNWTRTGTLGAIN